MSSILLETAGPIPAGHPEETKAGRGHFFAIDYRAWQIACDLGINAAVCYLMLARGTLRDNRTTMWSVNATEGRTGISRPKARIAIEALVESGLVEKLSSSLTRPKRRLVPGHLLPQIALEEPSLTKVQEEALAMLPVKPDLELPDAIGAALQQLIRRDTVRFDGSRYVAVNKRSEEPDWIWLPNTLIDGAADETPPIEMVRMAQDVSVLRLLVDLYHVHSLTFYAGIPTSFLKMRCETQEIAHQREYRIWDVWETTPHVSPDAPFFQPFLNKTDGSVGAAGALFWPAFETLQKLGYVHFVTHLFEGSNFDAEIIHPYEYRGRSVTTPAEDKLYWDAHEAAVALLPDFLRAKYYEEGIVPVRDHIRAVEARGVARLLYRPRTTVTAEWFALSRQWERWASLYRDLRSQLPPVKPF